MLHTSHYQLNKSHKFCVYIQPKLYNFLKTRSKGDISLYLEYAIQKYKQQLLHSKNLNTLKNASCFYQPKTKDYKRIVIRKISPELWKQLKEIKSITGYSISFILRILLEWEMEREGLGVEPLIPSVPWDSQENNYSNFFIPINNYRYHQWWNRQDNSIFSIFWDFP